MSNNMTDLSGYLHPSAVCLVPRNNLLGDSKSPQSETIATKFATMTSTTTTMMHTLDSTCRQPTVGTAIATLAKATLATATIQDNSTTGQQYQWRQVYLLR
jgi:hypothetical protein